MMSMMKVTLTAKAHDGKITVNTDIAVPAGDDDYQVTMNIVPQKLASLTTLDQLYGILADDPMLEITDEDWE